MFDQIYHVWLMSSEGKVLEFLGSLDQIGRKFAPCFVANEYIRFRCPEGSDLIAQEFRTHNPALILRVIGYSFENIREFPHMLVQKLGELPKQSVSGFTVEWSFAHKIGYVLNLTSSEQNAQKAIAIAERLTRNHLEKLVTFGLKLYGV